jgi:hypothetical protein
MNVCSTESFVNTKQQSGQSRASSMQPRPRLNFQHQARALAPSTLQSAKPCGRMANFPLQPLTRETAAGSVHHCSDDKVKVQSSTAPQRQATRRSGPHRLLHNLFITFLWLGQWQWYNTRRDFTFRYLELYTAAV